MHSKNKVVTECLCALGCEVLFGLSYVFTKKHLRRQVPLTAWQIAGAAIIVAGIYTANMEKTTVD